MRFLAVLIAAAVSLPAFEAAAQAALANWTAYHGVSLSNHTAKINDLRGGSTYAGVWFK